MLEKSLGLSHAIRSSYVALHVTEFASYMHVCLFALYDMHVFVSLRDSPLRSVIPSITGYGRNAGGRAIFIRAEQL